jgi:hypothetical protein
MTHQEKDALRTELRGTQQALLAKAGEVVRLEDEVERMRAQLRDVAERQRAACAETLWALAGVPRAAVIASCAVKLNDGNDFMRALVAAIHTAPLVTEEKP